MSTGPSGQSERVTVGIDIGTTSVKALAVDGRGEVVARARVVHDVRSPAPDALEHDADHAWRRNPLDAFEQVADGLDVAAVNVVAMVPSLCAVDEEGRPLSPGLLYGDARGGSPTGANPSESGELVNFLRWCAQAHPEAAGFWPAQAVANHALCGVGGIDTVTAMTTLPLFDFTGWDEKVAAGAGARVEQLPVIVSGSDPLGRTTSGALVGGGSIDAFAEQLVAGADQETDVLVILGTTLIVWVVSGEWREVDGLWTVPHTAPGLTLIGGASNAGGLFLDWVNGVVAEPAPDEGAAAPDDVPVWLPYLRGERVPFHDPARRASVFDLDRTMDAGAVRRGALEASAFVVRRIIDLSGVRAGRLVVTGGGARHDRWVQALADGTELPVDVVAVPEGGAYGAAYLARQVAGLEAEGASAGRWARTARRVTPDPAWIEACRGRYERFRALDA